MKVFAIVSSEFNDEYGYEEYSLPIEITSSKELAEQIKAELELLPEYDYSEIHVVEYSVK